jgi:ankyrin repeat protein
MAIASGNYVDASFLIGRGASVEKATHSYLSPLWVLVKSRCDDPKSRSQLARLLIERGADLHNPRPNGHLELPIVYMIDDAISKCDVELTRVFLEHGAKPSASSIEFVASFHDLDSVDPGEFSLLKLDEKAIRKMGKLLTEKGVLK